MRKIVRIVGSIVLAALMYCVPIVFTCAFCLGWDGFMKLILLICAVGQVAILAELVYFKCDERDE